MHIFSVIVWLGGLMFQNAIAMPVIQLESEQAKSAVRKMNKRFVGFIWMSVWTILITGIIMMLLSPNFVWFQFTNRWSALLLAKQIIFVLMILYAFGHARMLSYLEAPASNGGFNERAELYRHRLTQFRRISIALGLTALLLASAM